MKKVRITIDNRTVDVPENISVLDACKKIGINIPTLCYHELLKPLGACRMCVVEIDNKLKTSCSTTVQNGMNIKTHTQKVLNARQTILKLMIADHNNKCLTCPESNECKLFKLADIEDINSEYKATNNTRIIDKSGVFIRNNNICINCGKCVNICSNMQSVEAIGFTKRGNRIEVSTAFNIPKTQTNCVSCGQCVLNCPTNALKEVSDIENVWNALRDKDKVVIAQIAPSVRVSIGEEFGFEPGTILTKKLVSALKLIGFNKVFDTQTGADFTIVEESTELIKIITNNKEKELPLMTSCCPAWTSFVKKFYPEISQHLSSVKSPQAILGSLIKNYYSLKNNIPKNKIIVVSIMPCIAKKQEIQEQKIRDDVDYVLTTRETAEIIKQAGINIRNIDETDFDPALGISTGAGAIFGVTGGVLEAALRTTYELLENKKLEKIEFRNIRNFKYIREGEIRILNKNIKYAVIQTLGEARKVLENIKNNKNDYDFIEVMACPGGCIGGGGQPKNTNMEIIKKRAQAIYNIDANKTIRKSHENPIVKRVYSEFLKHPNSDTAKRFLHTR